MLLLWLFAVLRVGFAKSLGDPSSISGLRGARILYDKLGRGPRRHGKRIPIALVYRGNDWGADTQIHPSVDSTDRRMLVTTAYWNIESKRGSAEESDAVYRTCMADVMTLNAPLVIYGDAKALNEMQNARGDAVPALVGATQLKIEELTPCSEHRQMLFADSQKFTNENDVPTVELGCIWDGKPGLLARSAQDQPGYAWYLWQDVCMGHGEIAFNHSSAPWPSPERIQQLPQNRITVSYSEENRCEDCRGHWRYCHCLAGTSFVVPGAMVMQFAGNFSKKVAECLEAFAFVDTGAFVCLSDQVIMTKMLLDNPDVFFISSSGYGSVVTSYLSRQA